MDSIYQPDPFYGGGEGGFQYYQRFIKCIRWDLPSEILASISTWSPEGKSHLIYGSGDQESTLWRSNLRWFFKVAILNWWPSWIRLERDSILKKKV